MLRCRDGGFYRFRFEERLLILSAQRDQKQPLPPLCAVVQSQTDGTDLAGMVQSSGS